MTTENTTKPEAPERIWIRWPQMVYSIEEVLDGIKYVRADLTPAPTDAISRGEAVSLAHEIGSYLVLGGIGDAAAFDVADSVILKRTLPSIQPAPTTAAREQFEKDFAAWQAQMAEDIERTRDSERLTAEDMTLRVGSSSAQSSTTAARFALSSQCDCDAHSSCPYPDKCRCACHRPEGLTAKGDERCERCGHVNGCAWFAPSPLWNKVVREHGHSEMLCPMCFMELAEDAGVSPTAWQLTEEGDPIEAAKEIVAMAQAETTTAAIHAAAREVANDIAYLEDMAAQEDVTSKIAGIISRHLGVDSATDRAELMRILTVGKRWRDARTAYHTDASLTCREYGEAGDALAVAITESLKAIELKGAE